jgi:hypothetical protein
MYRPDLVPALDGLGEVCLRAGLGLDPNHAETGRHLEILREHPHLPRP